MPFKPMLAASCDDLDALKYPLSVSPKLDGIRCVILEGVATSRSLKPIPNQFIQSVLARHDLNGLDGELMVAGSFQDVTSGIMSVEGCPDFTFFVFDDATNPSEGFQSRDRRAHERVLRLGHPRVKYVPQTLVHSKEVLTAVSAENLALGYEGVMVRSPNGPYKQGRATFKEGYLTKLKPFEDAEAVIVGFEERMHNANEATTNALGRTERSSHKANLVPMGTLGALIVKNDTLWPGRTFNLGTGFTDAQRAQYWLIAVKKDLLGATVKFRYQAIGTKDAPRIPVFLGFRDVRDLS